MCVCMHVCLHTHALAHTRVCVGVCERAHMCVGTVCPIIYIYIYNMCSVTLLRTPIKNTRSQRSPCRALLVSDCFGTCLILSVEPNGSTPMGQSQLTMPRPWVLVCVLPFWCGFSPWRVQCLSAGQRFLAELRFGGPKSTPKTVENRRKRR